MKRWYDGYEIGGERAIYNPYAVMRAIKRGSFESYWASTNTFESLKQYITMNFDGLKADVVSLLNDVPVKVNSLRFSNDMHRVECKDDVLTLLCHLGYLSYNSVTKCASIPNYEVRQEFEAAVADTGWTEVMVALQQSEQLMECVLEGEADEVAALVEQVHQQNTSVLRYNNENALACVLSLAFYTARNRYQMVRELPSGKGFADIVLLPLRGVDAPAIVLELKWNRSADTAIAQIKRQEYAGSLSGFAGEVLLVGISYNKKTKRHECRIERWGESLSLSLSKRELVTKLSLSSVQVGLLVESLRKPVLAKELRSLLGFKDPTYFKRNVIDVLSRDGLIAMTKPDKPTSPNQKYYLTEKGKNISE